MSPTRSLLFKLGELDAKVDQVLQLTNYIHKSIEEMDNRITSLENTRIRQKAYLRAMVVIGSIFTGLLGKIAFFSHLSGKP